MPRRSELVTRGDARAANRALLRAVGLTDEDFEKPFIGVINTWSEDQPRPYPSAHLGRSGQAGDPRRGRGPF